MTTATANFAVEHSSDATFRVWGKGTSDLLQAAGAVKTADTGQIDWATVVRPAVSAYAGYEMYKLTDATGDYYLRIQYGTGSVATYPALYISFGKSTDGAGNLAVATKRDLGQMDRPMGSAVTVFTHYACVKDGILTIQWGNVGLLTIERRRDQSTGAPVASDDFVCFSKCVGIAFGGTSGAMTMVSWRNAPVMLGGPTVHFAFVPMGLTASASGDKYLYYWHGAYPGSRIAMAGCTYIGSEIAAHATFQVALLGGTSRTYRATGLNGAANGGVATYSAAVLWE